MSETSLLKLAIQNYAIITKVMYQKISKSSRNFKHKLHDENAMG